ncbi:TIGR04283 family arsenosugar biosynthesis glycosyltransferase [Hyphomicrobium sp.]|jgi:rSAM/selenodomain-associated transferase 2|uniref:TIGR04283 family arsenosugar biosynthesis glycosyltransferase n=1 Tax=Hyphomicrobium sp. TaxID=82 RepID=UPI002C23BB4F|nr:TIGR04283 family arsenosugar biosynthesis glycosyltransferase [Hyphomicrobium sp.]HVZ06152.1 TIGR04283 family arsenosugar biosynthesis glycosyltransferase [Hyphomicrobium sp.]
MISVVIPTRNSELTLAATLSALVPSAIDGIVRQVIVVDGGSTDQTATLADLAGADVILTAPGRAGQLAEGAAKARFPWLLFLNADTVLEEGWERSATAFMRRVDRGECAPSAGAFTFRLDDKGIAPRLIERLAHLRCKLSRVPYGDQGLLIPRQLFDAVGGYKDLPVLEDVDLARRLGRRRMQMLDAQAIASPEPYRRDGYFRRSLRNQACHALFGLGVPVTMIARIYGMEPAA